MLYCRGKAVIRFERTFFSVSGLFKTQNFYILHPIITGTNLPNPDPVPNPTQIPFIRGRLQTFGGGRCGSGAASAQLHLNGKDDEKRQKNFRKDGDAPRKHTAERRRWERGREKYPQHQFSV